MDPAYENLRSIITSAKLTLDIVNKQCTLVFDHDSTGHSFEYIGSGADKRVFRILKNKQHLNWVFCFPSNPRKKSMKKDIEYEMNTLQRLGKAKAAVPLPFRDGETGASKLILFELYDCDAGHKDEKVYGYIMEYLDRDSYTEMPKTGTTAARQKWLHDDIIKKQKNIFDKYKTKTKESFHAIEKAWKEEAWGDFQVLYSKGNGELLVIDPNNVFTSVRETDKIIKSWSEDLSRVS